MLAEKQSVPNSTVPTSTIPGSTVCRVVPATPLKPRVSHRLDCLEVWGGNGTIDADVALTGLDVWVWSRPVGSSHGGDVYLASMCGCAEVSRFLLADVAGHGLPVAKLGRRLRRLMRRHVNKPDQTRLARRLNRDLLDADGGDRFATMLLATYFPPTGHLILCNAGHPWPLWYRAETRRWTSLDQDTSTTSTELNDLPLGIAPGVGYTQSAIQMAPGDLLLLHTDGVSDAVQGNGTSTEQRMLDRLQSLQGVPPHQLLPQLRQTVLDELTADGPDDDMTLMLLSANGGQPPVQGVGDKFRVIAKMIGLPIGR